jgi:hypothetical protein
LSLFSSFSFTKDILAVEGGAAVLVHCNGACSQAASYVSPALFSTSHFKNKKKTKKDLFF